MTRPGYEAVLSCGDTTEVWEPAAKTYAAVTGNGDGKVWHFTSCPHPLCRGQRRLVREIRPVAATPPE